MPQVPRRLHPLRHPRLGIARAIAAIGLLSALIVPLASVAPARAGQTAVTTSELNLRTGPGYGYDIRYVMGSGDAVTITGDPRNGFYKIIHQGTNGWALGDFLDFSGGGGGSSSGGATGDAATTSTLNLRAGPGTNFDVLAVMPSGAPLSLTGETSGDFLGVVYSGIGGWAHGSWIGAAAPGGGGGGGGQDPGSGNTGSATVTSALNLRAGPSKSDSVILVMPGGAAVTLTGASLGGFLGVTYNGTAGWAFADYLDTSGGGGGAETPVPPGTGNAIIDIIYAAADRYGQPRADMLRVAQCESGLDPNNYTPPYGASGLFQFLPGTWATTPYANDDIFDAYASANAAGWMWSVGRRNEWVCQ